MDQTVEKYRIFCSNGCGRSYIGRNRKYNLQHHLKYKCGVNPQFQCTVCPTKFRNNDSLKCHMMKIHQICIFK